VVFCPTLLFYQSGYSIYVLRQASQRSFRISQDQPVKVKYLHYRSTMQESCLRLMGKKLLVSLAMEGKFSGEGLQSIDDGDDILVAMARALVTEKGIGERADAVWRQVQKQQEEMMTRPVIEDEEQEAADEVKMENKSPETEPIAANPQFSFGITPEVEPSKRSRRPLATETSQMSLF
jgi:hypothetical protein